MVNGCRDVASDRCIDQLTFKNGDLSLSKLNPDVRYIALDNSIPIRQILDIKGCDKYLVVATFKGIHLYSSEGKLIRRIGNIGNGPEEYTVVSDFCIDKDANIIYILSRSKVMIFNIAGDFLSSFKTYESGMYDRIKILNGDIYLFDSFSFCNLDYNWVVLDTFGNLVEYKRNFIPAFKSSISYKVNLSFDYKGCLFYWNPLNDTIFRISETETDIGWIFMSDQTRITQTDLYDESSFFGMNKWLLTSVIGYQDYLILEYEYFKNQEKISVWYNTDSNIGTVVNRIDSKEESPGIDNNWDSKKRFSPKSVIYLDGLKYLISWENSFEFKEKILSSENKNSDVSRKDRKSELLRMASDISEDSNPVITLVSF